MYPAHHADGATAAGGGDRRGSTGIKGRGAPRPAPIVVEHAAAVLDLSEVRCRVRGAWYVDPATAL